MEYFTKRKLLKNKYITERKILNTLKNRALILRISNIIGLDENKRNRKLHKTFIDVFIKNIKKISYLIIKIFINFYLLIFSLR